MFVFEWRSQSERQLRETKGSGMTDEQVFNFVNGCMLSPSLVLAVTDRVDYPAYELFTNKLRAGAFDEGKGRQLRLVIGRDRRVREVVKM